MATESFAATGWEVYSTNTPGPPNKLTDVGLWHSLDVRWHMERELAPLLFKDESPPTPEDPVAPARRSASADHKARRKHNQDGLPVRSFRSLLDELATLTKNLVAPLGAGDARFWQLSQPTRLQERAFQLLGIKLRVAKTPAA